MIIRMLFQVAIRRKPIRPIAATLLALSLAWTLPVRAVEQPPLSTSLQELTTLLQRGQFQKVIQASQTVQRQNPQAPINEMLGIALAGVGDTAAATQALAKAASSGQPDTVLVHLAEAMIFQVQGQYDRALAVADQARALAPNHPLVHLSLGLAYLNQRNHEQAKKSLQLAVLYEPQLAHAYTALAANYQTQGNVHKALLSYYKAIEIDPQDARPVAGLADLYRSMGLSAEAIKAYQTALALNPSLLPMRLRLAGLLLQTGQYDEGIAAAKTVLETHPNAAEAHFIIGRGYADKGDFAAAIVSLQQLVKMQPAAFQGHLLLGYCRLTLGNFQAARKQFVQAEALDAQSVETAIGIGLVEHLEGQVPQAISRFKKVLNSDSEPTRRLAHMLLANAYLAQQQWATAKTHLGQGHGVTTDFDAKLLQPEIHFRAVPATSFSWTNLALVYRLKGWHRKSIEASDRALKKEPVNPLALAIKGKALAQSQQPNAAIKSFQQLAANAPWSAAAYFEIAEIHLATNAPAQAVRAYQKAIELQPNDPSIFFRLGGAYAAAGKDREAADAYRQVITLSPDAAIGYNELAYFYADRQEHLDEAQALAQKALELAPGNGPIMDTLGWVYFKRGAYLEAANQLERAAAQIPGAASVHYHLGMAYFKMGESHKAQNAFHFALRLAPQFNEAGHARQMLAQLKSE